MPFAVPELIIESIIRDGLENVRNDETAIDDVFGNLTRSFAQTKYGQKEINKIKKLLKSDISVVHSWHVVESTLPCFSIALAKDSENIPTASMGDHYQTINVPFSTPEKIASVTKVGPFQPTSYDSKSGTVKVPDAVDLSQIYANLVYVDTQSVEHTILGGIVNEIGKKQFVIAKQSEIDISGQGEIKTTIDYDSYNVNQNKEMVNLVIGAHSKDPLTTKYLYVLLKYFMLSRKDDICKRDMQLTTYEGSDFSRDQNGYGADMVFTRFVYLNGLMINTWRADKVQLIDNVQVDVQIDEDC